MRIDESNGVFTDTIPTTLDGGDGNDNLAGGTGGRTLRGGTGNDTIDGNGGNDLALLGAGDDTFVWDPGDGSDTVEGQTGTDTMRFNGAPAAEHVDLSANGKRLRFFRDLGQHHDGHPRRREVDFNALGGADAVTVNDLTGTDVRTSTPTSPARSAAPPATARPTASSSTARRSTTRSTSRRRRGRRRVRPATRVAIQHQDPTDALAVNGLAGDDAIDAAASPPRRSR